MTRLDHAVVLGSLSACRVLKLEGDIVHASCVAVNGKGVLILGRSGRGKSHLAAELISRGADLVADDQVKLALDDGLVASGPDALAGLLEIRGVGLLQLPHLHSAKVCLVVDLDRQEMERMPQIKTAFALGQELPMLELGKSPIAAATIVLRLQAQDVISR
ncbi:MAG: HPr kinase/phosphatase C-terminal domain-containing protein [Pseudomonadota bacterium]